MLLAIAVTAVLAVPVLLSGAGPKMAASVVPTESYQNLTFDGALDSNMVSVGVLNSGDVALEISDVRTSCGMRVLDGPDHTVEPGQTATINIVVPKPPDYSDGREHTVTEHVVLRTNAPSVFAVIPVRGSYR
ncbi:DUF1573 domain-containing protein [Rubrivirga sp.]|uniref:DUF1573 domain-containing protein n=1 Tax=Rubrivirga sp. TaxID=1885344 RepID=UPI003B523794